MQSSSQWYRSVVFSRKCIQSMEVCWLLLVGAWKTCVTLDLRYTTTPDHLSFFSWVREKCPLVCPSSSFPFSVVQPTDYFQLLDHRRYHSLARFWEGFARILLF